jgi:hypothetical protein
VKATDERELTESEMAVREERFGIHMGNKLMTVSLGLLKSISRSPVSDMSIVA